MGCNFSLRRWFVAFAVMCVICASIGAWFERERRKDASITHLRNAGAAVRLSSEGTVCDMFRVSVLPHMGFLKYYEPKRSWRKHVESVELTEQVLQTGVLAVLNQWSGVPHLRFERCSLGDAEWDELSSLERVEYLEVHDMAIDAAAILRACGPRLVYLSLRNCRVSADELKGLEELRNLRVVDLADNPIGGDIVESLAALPRLERVHLRDTAVDANAARLLCDCPPIRHIEISDAVMWRNRTSKHGGTWMTESWGH